MAGRRLKRGVWARLYRRARYFYLRLLLVHDTPRRMAKGMAIGVFIGCLPIIPFQTVAAIALAGLMRSSMVVAAMGTWVTNPLTTAPFYAAFFYLGRAITSSRHTFQFQDFWDFQRLMAVGTEVFLTALLGGVIIGLIAAPVTYLLVFKYINRLQSWERRKLREKFALPPPPS